MKLCMHCHYVQVEIFYTSATASVFCCCSDLLGFCVSFVCRIEMAKVYNIVYPFGVSTNTLAINLKVIYFAKDKRRSGEIR